MDKVKQYGWSLQFASKDMKRNGEVVMAAVKQDGGALKFSSEDLKRDREITMAAVKQNGDVSSQALDRKSL